MLHSSRVARPQDASKAPYLVSLLSSSARVDLDVSEVAAMENRLGTASRYVDPAFPAFPAQPATLPGFRPRSGQSRFRRVC